MAATLLTPLASVAEGASPCTPQTGSVSWWKVPSTLPRAHVRFALLYTQIHHLLNLRAYGGSQSYCHAAAGTIFIDEGTRTSVVLHNDNRNTDCTTYVGYRPGRVAYTVWPDDLPESLYEVRVERRARAYVPDDASMVSKSLYMDTYGFITGGRYVLEPGAHSQACMAPLTNRTEQVLVGVRQRNTERQHHRRRPGHPD